MIMATLIEQRTYSGAARVPEAAWLPFVGNVLSALGEAEHKQARKKRGYSGLWTKKIHGSLPVVTLLRKVAERQGKLMVEVNDSPVGYVELDSPPLPTDTGLAVSIAYQIFNNPVRVHGLTIPYPTPVMEDLCYGRWADFGMARVYAPQLLPEITTHGADTVLEWAIPLTVQFGKKGLFGFVRWITQTKLHRIMIGPKLGWFELSGLGKWVVPDLEWAA